MFKTTVTRTITDEQVKDALISAIEYGSGYWMMITETVCPDEDHTLETIPLLEGGAWLVQDREENGKRELDEPVRVDAEAIGKGLQIMADKYPKTFADQFMDGDFDADTADVFMQCVVFGKVIYG